jgi:hypothetical protein
MSDPLIQLLAGLPPAEPVSTRAGRIRTRCRVRLVQQAPSAQRASAPRNRTAQAWQPLVTVLGAAYLAAVIVQALRVYGFP